MQLQCRDQARLVDRKLLGNGRAHRLTRHVSPRNTELSEHRRGVVRHLVDRVAIVGNVRLADPAVVEQDALIARAVGRDLERPQTATLAGAWNEQQWLTLADDLVSQVEPTGHLNSGYGSHGLCPGRLEPTDG